MIRSSDRPAVADWPADLGGRSHRPGCRWRQVARAVPAVDVAARLLTIAVVRSLIGPVNQPTTIRTGPAVPSATANVLEPPASPPEFTGRPGDRAAALASLLGGHPDRDVDQRSRPALESVWTGPTDGLSAADYRPVRRITVAVR